MNKKENCFLCFIMFFVSHSLSLSLSLWLHQHFLFWTETLKKKKKMFFHPFVRVQIRQLTSGLCIDSPGNPEDLHQPVGFYECHNQGGNQVHATPPPTLLSFPMRWFVSGHICSFSSLLFLSFRSIVSFSLPRAVHIITDYPRVQLCNLATRRRVARARGAERG